MVAAARVVALLLILAGMSGCGVSAVHQEGLIYHRQLEEKAAADYADCSSAARTTSFAQHQWGNTVDCFDLVVKRSPVRFVGTEYQQLKLDNAYTIIDHFALMAMFSKMVYHRYEDVDKRSLPESCYAHADKHPLNALYANSNEGLTGRWKLWNGGRSGCISDKGLYFETYVFFPQGGKPGERFTRAVIVFRGTENYQSQRFEDWSDNFKAAFGKVPAQYEIAADVLPGVVAQLENEGVNDAVKGATVEIYTAGHSLGGGLAQLAAYRLPQVRAAFAFNSSPVTGWTWLSHKARENNWTLVSDPQIYRIWQRGEGLQFLRRVSSGFNSDRFGRSDYEFDFRALGRPKDTSTKDFIQGAVHEHDIGLLACNLAMRVALSHSGKSGSGAADFDFSGAMARNALEQADELVDHHATNEKLCTSDILGEIRWAYWDAIDLSARATTASR